MLYIHYNIHIVSILKQLTEFTVEGVNDMFLYCKKCGLITRADKSQACPACEIAMSSVPQEYLTSSGLMFVSQNAKKEFEEVIKNSEDFDAQAFAMRESIIAKKKELADSELQEKVSEYQQSAPKARCPVCQSQALTKISNLGKVVKVSAFGILGAGDIGKTYKCGNCGYKF